MIEARSNVETIEVSLAMASVLCLAYLTARVNFDTSACLFREIVCDTFVRHFLIANQQDDTNLLAPSVGDDRKAVDG